MLLTGNPAFAMLKPAPVYGAVAIVLLSPGWMSHYAPTLVCGMDLSGLDLVFGLVGQPCSALSPQPAWPLRCWRPGEVCSPRPDGASRRQVYPGGGAAWSGTPVGATAADWAGAGTACCLIAVLGPSCRALEADQAAGRSVVRAAISASPWTLHTRRVTAPGPASVLHTVSTGGRAEASITGGRLDPWGS